MPPILASHIKATLVWTFLKFCGPWHTSSMDQMNLLTLLTSTLVMSHALMRMSVWNYVISTSWFLASAWSAPDTFASLSIFSFPFLFFVPSVQCVRSTKHTFLPLQFPMALDVLTIVGFVSFVVLLILFRAPQTQVFSTMHGLLVIKTFLTSLPQTKKSNSNSSPTSPSNDASPPTASLWCSVFKQQRQLIHLGVNHSMCTLCCSAALWCRLSPCTWETFLWCIFLMPMVFKKCSF